jgi:hypothetical protein
MVAAAITVGQPNLGTTAVVAVVELLLTPLLPCSTISEPILRLLLSISLLSILIFHSSSVLRLRAPLHTTQTATLLPALCHPYLAARPSLKHRGDDGASVRSLALHRTEQRWAENVAEGRQASDAAIAAARNVHPPVHR